MLGIETENASLVSAKTGVGIEDLLNKIITLLPAGRSVMILFNKSSIPTPVFAETREAFSVSIPSTSSICDFILSGSEEGRSILFRTGSIS